MLEPINQYQRSRSNQETRQDRSTVDVHVRYSGYFTFLSPAACRLLKKKRRRWQPGCKEARSERREYEQGGFRRRLM
jgi:hypothetical protein